VDTTWFMLSALFSLIGTAVFVYGRKQRTATHTLIGIALMIYPYFVSGVLPLIGIGVLLIAGIVVGNNLESS
jgi:hypothetical protein